MSVRVVNSYTVGELKESTEDIFIYETFNPKKIYLFLDYIVVDEENDIRNKVKIQDEDGNIIESRKHFKVFNDLVEETRQKYYNHQERMEKFKQKMYQNH